MKVVLLSALLVTLTTLGQYFLKVGAQNEKSIFINKFVLLGYLSLLVVLSVSYYLMSLIELKYFSMIMGINYLSIMVMSILFFDEKTDMRLIIGTSLVCAGIVVFFI